MKKRLLALSGIAIGMFMITGTISCRPGLGTGQCKG